MKLLKQKRDLKQKYKIDINNLNALFDSILNKLPVLSRLIINYYNVFENDKFSYLENNLKLYMKDDLFLDMFKIITEKKQLIPNLLFPDIEDMNFEESMKSTLSHLAPCMKKSTLETGNSDWSETNRRDFFNTRMRFIEKEFPIYFKLIIILNIINSIFYVSFETKYDDIEYMNYIDSILYDSSDVILETKKNINNYIRNISTTTGIDCFITLEQSEYINNNIKYIMKLYNELNTSVNLLIHDKYSEINNDLNSYFDEFDNIVIHVERNIFSNNNLKW